MTDEERDLLRNLAWAVNMMMTYGPRSFSKDQLRVLNANIKAAGLFYPSPEDAEKDPRLSYYFGAPDPIR
jgi:hypothetical protein